MKKNGDASHGHRGRRVMVSESFGFEMLDGHQVVHLPADDVPSVSVATRVVSCKRVLQS